jgi:L-threonylcarbamoyladenylate synthase
VPIIKKINPVHPDGDTIGEAAAVIQKGGVAAFPTRHLYGLGADASNRAAVERIFAVKQRLAAKPLLVLIHDPAQLNGLVSVIPPAADRIIKLFWPGRVTIVMPAKASVLSRLTAGTGKIGVRLASHPVAAALIRAVGRPVTGTSANLSGMAGCRRVADIQPAVLAELDVVLDAGGLETGKDGWMTLG